MKFDRPPLQPSCNVPAMIVYVGSGGDVDTVLIDGRIVVRDRTVLMTNERVVEQRQARHVPLYRRAGWELRPDGATPPPSSVIERYPSERIAVWGARLAALKQRLGLGRRRN